MSVKLSFNTENQIATLTMEMAGKVNKINEVFVEDFAKAIDEMTHLPDLRGVMLLSSHADFCVGADLDMVLGTQDASQLSLVVTKLSAAFRKLETCGKPVVALLAGSAFGGGYEIALACHRRIALNQPKLRVGLPEVSLGLFPGAGGSQRLPRMIGIQNALENILQAKMHNAKAALEAGFVDELVDNPNDLITRAQAWIDANPNAKQPWDDSAYVMPGPAPKTEEARQLFMVASAMLEKKTAGAMLAPQVALAAIQEGLKLNFDKATEVEARYFVQIATSTQAKDMIKALWLHRSAVEKQEGLPQIQDARIQSVAILGAGMMGAGLAVVCAKAGYQVVLKDIAQSSLDVAMKRCRSQCRDDVYNRITPTLDAQALADCDLVIEAVFENLELKHQINREIEPLLKPDAIWASNTSALPISELAQSSKRPANFIGLHYFSPPEKMQLVEIIVSKETSDETLARCLNFSKATRKLPIVVNDAYAFFTSRVFCAYITEGAELVAEGHDPVVIEWAAKKSGMAVAPLQVFDEVTLTLLVHASSESERYWGKQESKGLEVVKKMVALGRKGKAAQMGFYDYEGKRKIWSGLKDLVQQKPQSSDLEYLQKRLMLIQCAQVAQAIDLGIIRNYRDVEVGAIFGIGFAPQTGGPLAYMDRMGIRNVVTELEALSATLGKRYAPARILYDMAEKGQRFFA